jgi:hypothetical protein
MYRQINLLDIILSFKDVLSFLNPFNQCLRIRKHPTAINSKVVGSGTITLTFIRLEHGLLCCQILSERVIIPPLSLNPRAGHLKSTTNGQSVDINTC